MNLYLWISDESQKTPSISEADGYWWWQVGHLWQRQVKTVSRDAFNMSYFPTSKLLIRLVMSTIWPFEISDHPQMVSFSEYEGLSYPSGQSQAIHIDS